MSRSLRSRSLLTLMASALATVAALRLDAQSTARLAPCGAADPQHQPCALPFERPPRLRQQAAFPEKSPDERRTAQLWLYIGTSGAVQGIQIHRSAGIDWDQAAVELARQYVFEPATLAGRPTSAWVLLDVAAVPKPQTCADFEMAMPVSAGVAQFVDSLVYDKPELGRTYRYRTTEGFLADLFIYPQDKQSTPLDEVTRTLDALQSGNLADGPDSMRVRARGAQQVRTDRGHAKHAFVGHSARLRLWSDGHEAESYIGVFPAGVSYLKFRVTHPPTRRARGVVDEFTRQMLANEHWRALGCPR